MSTLSRICPYCRSVMVKTNTIKTGKKKGKKQKQTTEGVYVFTCFHCGLSVTSLVNYPNNVDLYISGKRVLNWKNKLKDLKKPVYKYNTESYFLEKRRVEGYLTSNTSTCHKCQNPTKKMHIFHEGTLFSAQRCIVCGSVMFNEEMFTSHREKIKLLNLSSFTNVDSQIIAREETGVDKNALFFNQLDEEKRGYISDCLTSSKTVSFSSNSKSFINDEKKKEQLKFYIAKCIVKTNCNLIYAYFSLMRNGESLKFYFVDIPKNDEETVDVSDKYPSINSLLAKELFNAQANGKRTVTIEGKFVYDIIEYAVFKPYPYIHKINKRRIVRAIENIQEIYVYYRLNMPCISRQHPVDTVTLVTKDFKGNGTVQVNAYYCKKCKRYFVNYEALQNLYDKNRYPVFHFVFEDQPADGFNLNKVSKLGSCGYSVRQGGMSTDERHRLLRWIIDNHILSRAEIIGNIEFFIGYHGKQDKNKNAVAKWQEDIYFVSHYTKGNERIITSNNFKR